MKTKLIALFLSLVLVLVLSACGGAAAPAATAVPADNSGGDATAAPAGDSGGATGSTVFTNTGAVDLCELYLAPIGTQDWSANQLTAGQKIVVGDKFTLNKIPVGQYDVNAVGCDGTKEANIQIEVK